MLRSSNTVKDSWFKFRYFAVNVQFKPLVMISEAVHCLQSVTAYMQKQCAINYLFSPNTLFFPLNNIFKLSCKSIIITKSKLQKLWNLLRLQKNTYKLLIDEDWLGEIISNILNQVLHENKKDRNKYRIWYRSTHATVTMKYKGLGSEVYTVG